MEFDINILLIVLPAIFLGGFVDAIAGGGGVINMAGLMIAGVPMHYAIGVNKTQALFGTSVATANYVRKGHYRKSFILFSVLGSLTGAFMGAQLAMYLSDQTLKIMMTVILPLISIMIISGKMPKFKLDENSKKNIVILSFLIGITVGFYDGALGPGAGTFYIIGFSMCGLTMLEANGNAKIVNLVSNIVAATIFILNGKIIIWLVIPCIVVSVIAGYLGSHVAIKNGEKIMRPVMILVLVLLFIKTIYEIVL